MREIRSQIYNENGWHWIIGKATYKNHAIVGKKRTKKAKMSMCGRLYHLNMTINIQIKCEKYAKNRLLYYHCLFASKNIPKPYNIRAWCVLHTFSFCTIRLILCFVIFPLSLLGVQCRSRNYTFYVFLFAAFVFNT